MNIELHGFQEEGLEKMIDEIWSKLICSFSGSIERNQVVVTSVPVTTNDLRGRIAPFFRVYSNQADDFQIVAELLNQVKAPGAGMRTFVECVLLERRIVL